MRLLPIKYSLLIICVFFLCGCAGNPARNANAAEHLSKATAGTSVLGTSSSHDERHILEKIYQQHHDWKDVPYRWGGLSRKGLDCSGLVYLIYRNQFGVELPRTTVGQVKRGRHVNRSSLRAGDLLFFKTGKNLNHVGIYVENNQFLHVSTKKGVKISSLENSYWSKRYRQSRRVL